MVRVNFGCLTNLDKSKARANCAYSRGERGLFGCFFYNFTFVSLFYLPLFGRRPDID